MGVRSVASHTITFRNRLEQISLIGREGFREKAIDKYFFDRSMTAWPLEWWMPDPGDCRPWNFANVKNQCKRCCATDTCRLWSGHVVREYNMFISTNGIADGGGIQWVWYCTHCTGDWLTQNRQLLAILHSGCLNTTWLNQLCNENGKEGRKRSTKGAKCKSAIYGSVSDLKLLAIPWHSKFPRLYYERSNSVVFQHS